MRLSHIKLAGFKSFPDPINITFPGDLVGVVGPNGCGKSNIIDAVRWVLGESKASALRGESMQDVIFNGSANRKPIGRTSVELLFDNSLGKATGQWSSYAEISIKRVLQRDGESSYHINNTRVRRRDIADIFLGTGVGGRGYAIIEQGMISRIIDAKPEELRLFLEEAAGVSKYRERRRETESRLTDARGNLLRVNDILQELEKQLQRLEEQASVANKFQDMQRQLHTAQNLLRLARKQEATAQRIRAEKESHRLEIDLELEISRLRDTENNLEEKRKQHYIAGDNLHHGQGELYAANAEVARIEQQVQYLHNNYQRLEQQILTARNQIEQNEEQALSNVDSLNHWGDEFKLANINLEVIRNKVAIENERLPLMELNSRLHRDKLKEIQLNFLLAKQNKQLEESQLTHSCKTLQQIEMRQEKLLSEKGTLSFLGDTNLFLLQQEMIDVSIELEQKQEALLEANNLLPEAEEVKRKTMCKVVTLEQGITQAEAKFDALQNLQNQIDGNKDLSAWLAKYQLDTLPRLWQSIQVEKGWEKATEAVLLERLNSIYFEQLEVVQNWIDDAPPGKLTLFEVTTISEKKSIGEISLSRNNWQLLQSYLTCDTVKTKHIMDEWLEGVFVVEDLEEGLLKRTRLTSREILVTRDGHIFTNHSLNYYVPDLQLHGVLVRQREIIEIESEVVTLRIELATEKSFSLVAEESYRGMEASILCLRQDSERLQKKYHDLQIQVLKLTQLKEQVSQRGNQILMELSEIERQVSAEVFQKQDIEKRLTEYGNQIEVLRELVQQEEPIEESMEGSLGMQRQLVQDVLQEMQEAVFHEKNCQNKITETGNLISVNNENTVKLKTYVEKLESEQGSFNETTLHNQLQEWLVLRTQRETILTTVRNTLESVNNSLQELEKERMLSEQKMHPLRESINQIYLKVQEAGFIENQFDEQLKEAKANEEELFLILGKTRVSRLQIDIDQLNVDIGTLGAVNLAALEELDVLQERKVYLDSQFKDLKEAIEILESVIRKIDRDTRERLLETFDKVNNNLHEIFPTIFGGGQAKLVLTGEEVLDAGVKIIAQPPGKKNSSIHLLSGGEKAMTALALVFSLFKLNPAPFCLLDEVDAPLDESNTERFCELVKKMSHQTQFLFISHNKITMEMAHQLIGVTMQEQGVSRVVTVDIEEAIRLSDTILGAS